MSANIDNFDALFIARHVLGKLGIAPERELDMPLARSAQLEEVITEIESLEEGWSFVPDGDGHSFGRKEQGETVKLWSVPKKSAEVLQNLAFLTGARTVLEVGTSAGYSTLHLAAGLATDGQVYTVELLPEKAALARGFFEKSGLTNIQLIEGEASEVLKDWDKGPINLVFLDADKENYAKYLELLLPHLRKGGLIVADNINDYGHLMEEYLQQVTGTHLPQSRTNHQVKSYYLAALDNGVMVTRKV